MKIHLPGWDDPGMPSEVGYWHDQNRSLSSIQYLFAQSPICYAKLDDLLKNPKTRHSGKSSFGGLAGMTVLRKRAGCEKENTNFVPLSLPLSPRRGN